MGIGSPQLVPTLVTDNRWNGSKETDRASQQSCRSGRSRGLVGRPTDDEGPGNRELRELRELSSPNRPAGSHPGAAASSSPRAPSSVRLSGWPFRRPALETVSNAQMAAVAGASARQAQSGFTVTPSLCCSQVLEPRPALLLHRTAASMLSAMTLLSASISAFRRREEALNWTGRTVARHQGPGICQDMIPERDVQSFFFKSMQRSQPKEDG